MKTETRLAAALVWLQLGGPFAHAKEPGPGAAALVAQARELVASEDYTWALATLRRALKEDPALATRSAGRMERRLGGLITTLELDSNPARRLALSPASGPAGQAAAQAVDAFLDGRDEEGALHASVAVGEAPDTATYRSLLRLVEQETGVRVSPLELLPRSALVARKLARAEREFFASRYRWAARECQQALWLDPRNALAWSRLGSARWKLGERAEAERAFRRSLALDPDDAHLLEFMRKNGLLTSSP